MTTSLIMTEEFLTTTNDRGASSKKGQHSDSDTKTAERWGCDYLDVEDFIKMMSDEVKK